MSKEKLIEVKKKLESKYVSYVIIEYELEQKQNIQGVVNNLGD